MTTNPDMHRDLSVTIDELAPSGLLLARADGPAGGSARGRRSARCRPARQGHRADRAPIRAHSGRVSGGRGRRGHHAARNASSSLDACPRRGRGHLSAGRARDRIQRAPAAPEGHLSTMAHSPLYAKILAEARAERRPRGRSRGLPSRHPDPVSNNVRPKAPAPTASELAGMSIADIAHIIARDWQPVNYAAKPYLEAMHELVDLSSRYGPAAEPADGIVLYFLSNARDWRGDTARVVKAHLRQLVKR